MENTDKKLSVVIIDDNMGDRILTEKAMKVYMGDAFQLKGFSTARDASKFLRDAADVDLIVLDLGLPDTRGCEDTFNRIKEVSANIPVVVLTGKNDHELAKALIEKGAKQYLVKDYLLQGQATEKEGLADAIMFALCRHNNLHKDNGQISGMKSGAEGVVPWIMGGYAPTTH